MTEPYEKYICDPGKLPVAYLDQTTMWLSPDGFERRIREMHPDKILWTLDYLLSNARMIRDAWMVEMKQTFDDSQRARRWMLERPVVSAFMKQLVLPVPSLHEQRFEVALKRIALNYIDPRGDSQMIAREALND